MRMSCKNDCAERKTNPDNRLSLAPWMHGGPLNLLNSGVERDVGVLVVDYSIEDEPRSHRARAAFNEYKNWISSEIDSGELLRDVVSKIQKTPWGDVPNPHGTRIQVRLPEGVTPPNAIDSGKVVGLPSWVKGEIQFETEPFKQPSAAQQDLFNKLSPPKSVKDSVRAD